MPSKPMTSRFVFCAAIYCLMCLPVFANPPVPKAGPPPQAALVRAVVLVVDALWTHGSFFRSTTARAESAVAEADTLFPIDTRLTPLLPQSFQKEGCTLDPYGNPIPPCKK